METVALSEAGKYGAGAFLMVVALLAIIALVRNRLPTFQQTREMLADQQRAADERADKDREAHRESVRDLAAAIRGVPCQAGYGPFDGAGLSPRPQPPAWNSRPSGRPDPQP